jgi:hypothetical protein
MVSPWWALSAAVPAVALRAFGGGRRKEAEEPMSRCAPPAAAPLLEPRPPAARCSPLP